MWHILTLYTTSAVVFNFIALVTLLGIPANGQKHVVCYATTICGGKNISDEFIGSQPICCNGREYQSYSLVEEESCRVCMANITDNGQLLKIVIFSLVTCIYPNTNTVSENITYKSKSSNAQLKKKKNSVA